MRRRAFLLVVLILAIGSCGGGDGDAKTPGVAVVLRQGDTTLRIAVEVAATVAERARGLMNRESLGERAGMLFLFRGLVRGSFHMKDTLIPLDIAFIRAGRITEIHSMAPCRASPCPLTTPQGSFEQALEVNEGTFREAGISLGAFVRIEGSLPSPE